MSALFVIARVGDQRIAFDAATVESVIDIDVVVPVPLAPRHVIGLCAVRSQVLTVIDVATVVGATADPATKRAVVVAIDGHRYALCVAAVEDVVAQSGRTEAIDLTIGEGWHGIATARVATSCGFALLIDPAGMISAPRQLAA